MSLHRSGAIPSVRKTRPDIDNAEQLDSFFSRALAKDPEHRIQSMTEFKQDLQSAYREPAAQPVVVKTEGAPARSKAPLLIALLIFMAVGAGLWLANSFLPDKSVNAEKIQVKANVQPVLEDTDIKGIYALNGIPNVDTSDSSLAIDLKKNPQRRFLNLSGAIITDAGLEQVRSLPLETIDLCHTSITDSGVQNICEAKSLEVVRLATCKNITGKSIRALARLPRLEVLWIGQTELTDDDLEPLGRIPSFSCLSISSNHRMDGSGLRNLANLPRFQELWAADFDFSPAGIRAISALTHLHILVVSNSNISDRDVASLSKLKLRDLDLAETNITDKCVKSLSSMKSLQKLNVEDCNLTSNGLKSLKAALPNCKIFRASAKE